jgi:hypothetical protein
MHPMDFHQIITKDIRPCQVKIGELRTVSEAGQILIVTLSLHILHEDKRLFHFAEGKQWSILLKCSHIQRANMPGKMRIGSMAPQKNLGPIRHVFVSKRT